MEDPSIDPDTVRSLIKVRGDLLFVLCDQHEPPAEYAARLWQAYKLLADGIETLKQASGVKEDIADTGWTIYSPKES
jgi:hypothetical protein